MRIAPIGLAMLLGVATLAQRAQAQSATEAAGASANTAPAVPANLQRLVQEAVLRMKAQTAAATPACPVGFSVQRRSNPGLEVTRTPDGRLAQELDVSLRQTRAAIVEADITVHGMTPRVRMIERPLGEYDDDSEEFALKGTAEEPIRLSAVFLKQLGTVSWAELTGVVFSDGTTWAPAGSSPCVARPSMVVLVGGAAQAK